MSRHNLFGFLFAKNLEQQRADAYREVLREFAKIGGTLFGPVPKDRRREFFCLDERTMIWHEEWTDEHKVHHVRTTRYDVRPHGIFKAQDGQPYQPLSRQEALNLYQAVHAYNQATREFAVPRMRTA
jgi:hypothetical protein